MVSVKKAFFSLAAFLAYFVGFLWLSTGIHEWLHLEVLQLLGGNGYIMKGWIGGYVVFTQNPSNPVLVALAGGLGVALIYSFLALWNWTNFNPEEYSALLPMIFGQLVYGVFEGLFVFSMPMAQYADWSQLVYLFGVIAGVVPAVLLMGKQLMAKFEEKD